MFLSCLEVEELLLHVLLHSEPRGSRGWLQGLTGSTAVSGQGGSGWEGSAGSDSRAGRRWELGRGSTVGTEPREHPRGHGTVLGMGHLSQSRVPGGCPRPALAPRALLTHPGAEPGTAQARPERMNRFRPGPGWFLWRGEAASFLPAAQSTLP